MLKLIKLRHKILSCERRNLQTVMNMAGELGMEIIIIDLSPGETGLQKAPQCDT